MLYITVFMFYPRTPVLDFDLALTYHYYGDEGHGNLKQSCFCIVFAF